MLNFLKSLFMPPPPSGALAKERLRLVLLSDHLSLAPDVVENLKRDLLEVISRYVEIDSENADVTFEHREREVAMLASIPITGVRERATPEASRLEAPAGSRDAELAETAGSHPAAAVDAAEPVDAGESGQAGVAGAPEVPPGTAEESLGEEPSGGEAPPARGPAIEAASPSSAVAEQQRPAQRRRRRKKRAPVVVQNLGTPAQA